jgi:hypothetical protein
MAKRPTQKTITSGFSSAGMLNYNVNEMLTAFDNTLSLDGSAPNAMSADFDMDSNDILNAGDITAVNVVITGTLSGAAVVGLTVTNNLADVASATTSATNLGLGTGDSPQFTAVNVGSEIVTDAKIVKLDGIEALADVTDTTNVAAALDAATLDTATVAATDLVLTKDVNTGNLQTVTAQSIADLGSGTWNAAGVETLTNKTITDIIHDGSITEQVYAWTTTTGAASSEFDPVNGTVQTVTLTGNITLTDNVAAGESFTLMIDDGTAYTVTWPTITWRTNAGAQPALATTGYTFVEIVKVGSTLFGFLSGDGT